MGMAAIHQSLLAPNPEPTVTVFHFIYRPTHSLGV
jgi:hypothetical protein